MCYGEDLFVLGVEASGGGLQGWVTVEKIDKAGGGVNEDPGESWAVSEL